jgi:hypothetical protein
MKRSLKVISAALLGVAWSGVLFAGDVTYTFDTPPDPVTNPQFTNALVVGSHSYPNTSDPHWQIWSSGAGAAIGGNPGGYFSISDATNGGQGLAFVFPEIDNGLPLKGFKIDMDIRAGNGTLGRPADGFSISFARHGDPILINASNGAYGGFAGGDDIGTAQGTAGDGDAENGSKTGVAVIFDAWQGNYLPDTPPANGGTGSTDREGIAVRLDDHTFIQLDLINNRNGADCVPTTQTTLANNGSGLSMQTGTNAVVLSGSGCSRVYGGTDASGTYANLVWQPLHVQIIPTTTNTYNLYVTWKGTVVVNTNLPTFNATPGRLILAGRTGGNNQNCHVDNIHLVTLPATNAVLQSVQGLLNGFKFTLSDAGASVVTNVSQAVLDGVNVLPQTFVSYSQTNGQAPLTFGVYTQAVKLVPGSAHTVNLAWLDTFGVNSFGTFSFTVPPWFELPAGNALPLSAVDQTKPGFLINRYQTRQFQPNTYSWNEEMVAGLHGPNIVGATTLTTEGGLVAWNGPLDFANGPGGTGGGLFPNSDPNSLLSAFGIGANYSPAGTFGQVYSDNSALEIFTYIYFPTSGVYNLVVGSDDGYIFSSAPNPRDRMGTLLGTLNGSLLPTGNTPFNALHPVIVDAPGVYPIRVLYENGGGGAGLEIYTAPPVGTTIAVGVNAFLLNDTNNNNYATTGVGNALAAYRALAAGQQAPPYLSKAVPVRDAQDVFYNQPIVVELTDGDKTVNQGSVALTIDGVASGRTISTPSPGITHIKQTLAGNWTVGRHTNVLSYQDNLGGNYTNTWAFTVMGGAVGIAAADPTNTPAMIPLASRVDPGTLSSPGMSFYSYQSLFKQPNNTGTAEQYIAGLLGPNIVNVVNAFGTNGFFLNTPTDFRFSANGGTGAGGEWTFDGSMLQFGFSENRQAPPPPVNPPRNIDNVALDIQCWLVFTNAGNYLMNVNSDDGFRLSSPNTKNLADKLGTRLGFADVGRGISGPYGGVPNNGTPFMITIPAAGAYPFRLVWENGGGDAALEWSVWVPQADGTYVHELINDPGAPSPIMASMFSSVQGGPYVTSASPAANQAGVPWFAPAVVKITDGPVLTTDNTKIDQLWEDGILQTFSASKSGNVTTVKQQLNAPHVYGVTHTNVLVYHDSSGTSYTNTWAYSTFGTGAGDNNGTPGTLGASWLVPIPANLTVPIASVDATQPGFRIKSYETTNSQNNTVAFTEQQFMGLQGPNVALNANDPPTAGGYWVWTNVIDFTWTQNGGPNSSSAEWNYDFTWTNETTSYFDPILSPYYGFANLPPSSFGFVTNPPGTTVQINNNALMIGAYLVFQHNGVYIGAISSDDCFKLTVPYGGGYWGIPGLLVGDCNAGRGSAGAGFGPRGGMTFCPFVITNAPCAVPMRLLWENGGGGAGVEFSMWMQQSDGSVAYKLVNDPFDPDTPQAFQTLTTPSEPSVVYQNLLPPLQYGSQRPDYGLSGNSASFTTNFVGPVQQDFVFGITNGSAGVNTNLAMHLLYKGIDQPFILTVSNNLLYVTRPANNPQWWPSGALGPLVFNYTDSNGAAQSINLGNVATPFWGALHNPVVLQDQNSPGFKARWYQVQDGGGQGLNNRVHQAEQVLATIWGTNSINPAHNPTNSQVSGYFIFPGSNPSNGVVNFDFAVGSQDGNFNSPGWPATPWPGIPGYGVAEGGNDNFAMELLAYITFPSNGVYTLNVNSDDGFRAIEGWTPPANKGAAWVTAPAALAGLKAAAFDSTLNSAYLTSPLTGQVAVVKGPVAPANGFGSTNFLGSGFSEDGCIINNAAELAGKIALIFRSPFCSVQQGVFNAQQAGAIGVLFVGFPLNFTNGEASPSQLPVERDLNSPPLNIACYGISWADGTALREAALTNPPNVILTPLDNLVNPPVLNNVLGQADFGKGASDILFPVVVTNAGTYAIRLTWFQGGGGANCEFSSVVNGTNVLVNDTVNGSPLKAYYALQTTVLPILSVKNNGNGTITLTYTGVLQSESNLGAHAWTDVPGASSPWTVPVPPTATPLFYRARSGP